MGPSNSKCSRLHQRRNSLQRALKSLQIRSSSYRNRAWATKNEGLWKSKLLLFNKSSLRRRLSTSSSTMSWGPRRRRWRSFNSDWKKPSSSPKTLWLILLTNITPYPFRESTTTISRCLRTPLTSTSLWIHLLMPSLKGSRTSTQNQRIDPHQCRSWISVTWRSSKSKTGCPMPIGLKTLSRCWIREFAF